MWGIRINRKRVIKAIIIIAIVIFLLFLSRFINQYPINKYQEKFERDDKGIILGMDKFYLEGNNDKAVILLHGLTDSPGNMEELAEFLNKKGYSVYVPLLPGHATKVQELNKKKYSDWYREAANTLEDVDEEKVYIVGHSLGGLLALDLASRNNINGIITINAPIQLKNRYIPFIPFVKIIEDYQIKSDENMDKLVENGFSVPYNAMPLNSVSELLNGIEKLKLENIDEPALIIQGIDDGVVDRDSALVIYDGINSTHKDLTFFEDATHEIINKEEGYNKVLNFISSY